MNKRDTLFLGHVLEAISAIESFTREGRAFFIADLKTQSAVVRQLEIIGEAVKQVSPDLTAAETAVPWRAISCGQRAGRCRKPAGLNSTVCRPASAGMIVPSSSPRSW